MKCLKCDERVVEPGAKMQNGSYCLKIGSKLKIEYEGNNSFVTCPHCGEKNILAFEDSKTGGSKLYFHPKK